MGWHERQKLLFDQPLVCRQFSYRRTPNQLNSFLSLRNKLLNIILEAVQEPMPWQENNVVKLEARSTKKFCVGAIYVLLQIQYRCLLSMFRQTAWRKSVWRLTSYCREHKLSCPKYSNVSCCIIFIECSTYRNANTNLLGV